MNLLSWQGLFSEYRLGEVEQKSQVKSSIEVRDSLVAVLFRSDVDLKAGAL